MKREKQLAGNFLRLVAPGRSRCETRERFGAIERVSEYWRELSATTGIPLRAAVDPREIGPALEYCFVLERIAPGVGRIRLAGQHLAALLGMDGRGMPLTALFEPESRRELAAAIEKCCSGPAIIRLDLQARGGFGRETLTGGMLLAPLRSADGSINRLLGCLQSAGKIGRQPRRFAIAGCRTCPAPDTHFDPRITASQNFAFAEPAKPFHPQPAPESRALRLVVDNS